MTSAASPEPEELPEDFWESVEDIVSGWYREGRIDWVDLLERIENHTDVDLGNSLDSPLIRRIKAYVRKMRREMA